MGVNVFPATTSKTRYHTTLTSGTSWTVPAGVTYVNVTLCGAGGGGDTSGYEGKGGMVVTSTLSTTPGASITYAIGAGGSGAGGSTTFTGATTATGGNTASGSGATTRNYSSNGGTSNSLAAPAKDGGNGQIDIEYWL